MEWQAVWQSRNPLKLPQISTRRSLPAMTLYLELSGPEDDIHAAGRGFAASPVRLWQGGSGLEEAISIYLLPDRSIRLVHGDVDLATAPGTLQPAETMSLRYIACAQGRQDLFEVINYDQLSTQRLRSGLAQALKLEDALPRDPRFLSMMHVAAVASDAIEAIEMPGFEKGTQLQTARGMVAVEHLEVGDELIDWKGYGHFLQWIKQSQRICLGRVAPVEFRPMFFGLSRRLVVTPNTRFLKTGSTVDYWCGTDAVFIEAKDMAIDRTVFRSRARAIRLFYHLLLEEPTCLSIGNCCVETAHLGDVINSGSSEVPKEARPLEADLQSSHPLLNRSSAHVLLTSRRRGY